MNVSFSDMCSYASRLQMCCVDSIKEIRASGFRAMRYFLTDLEVARLLNKYSVDVFIVK
jgi:hypothetical protein